MTFASKARFSGIIVAHLAKWLADQPDGEEKRDIFELIDAAKRDPAEFRPLRIKWAFYRLRAIAPDIIERARADLRDHLGHEWACLTAQVQKASPDWGAADRHLAAFHAHMGHAVHFEDVRPIIKTGAKVRKPFDDANERRRSDSVRRHAKWRALANKLRANPQHAGKSDSEIARLIAAPGDNVGTIRKAIKRTSK